MRLLFHQGRYSIPEHSARVDVLEGRSHQRCGQALEVVRLICGDRRRVVFGLLS